MSSTKRLPAVLLSAAAVLVSCLALGCGRFAPPSAAAPRGKWVKWNAEDFFTDARTIALCKAIETHDLPKIERLVKSGVDVNAKGRGNMTPLLFALPLGEDVLKKLLDLKADPNVRLTEQAWPILFEKGTSLMSAAASGTVTTPGPMHESYFGNVPMDNYLKIVLKHGGNPNIIVEDSSRETPLFRIGGDPATVRERIRQLVDAGADLNHKNYLGCTSLMWSQVAASNYVLSLLRAGADYRLTCDTGLDAILIFERQTMDLERKLRERPNDAWVQSDLSAAKPVRDWLANGGVNWAAARGAGIAGNDEEPQGPARRLSASSVVAAAADVEEEMIGATMVFRKPLILTIAAAVLVSCFALGCGRFVPPSAAAPRGKWVKWNAGDYFTDQGVIALCKAIEAHNLTEIDRLVKSGVDVNARGRGNMTPLLWAFPVGQDVFRKLLELGADPNVEFTARLGQFFLRKASPKG